MTHRLRFDPPSRDLPGALRWVLARALGPREGAAPTVDDGGHALELARAAALAALIGSRYSLEELAGEVGSRAAAAFKLEHEAARRAAEALLEMLSVVEGVARDAGAPLVLLKFVALTAAGHAPVGTRTAGDVDVLVGQGMAERVGALLLESGFVDAGFRDGPHQLPQLLDGAGRRLELHRHVPGVCAPGEDGPADVASLQAARALENVTFGHRQESSQWTVPSRELLVAHAIVHGVAQHGLKPQGYPLFRMVADLVDLHARSEDLAGVHLWISRDVSVDETAAALLLARRLAEGDQDVFAPARAATPDILLLRHLAATLVDGDYRSSLRLSRWESPPGLAREAWRALALTDAQIDVVYGPQGSRWGYTARRLLRPLDLVGRAARYAASALRVRLRR